MLMNRKNEAYIVWGRIFNECCSYKFKKDHPEFDGYTLCDDWKDFKSFEVWFNTNDCPENIKPIEKHYSPETVTYEVDN